MRRPSGESVPPSPSATIFHAFDPSVSATQTDDCSGLVYRVKASPARSGLAVPHAEVSTTSASAASVRALLDGDRLGQVPRLVDVETPEARDAVREQLQ